MEQLDEFPSTGNGMVNPYTAYIQPVQNQQNVNSHLSEQINGVQTMQHMYGAGTPGVEMPMGGGLVNPNASINYLGPTY